MTGTNGHSNGHNNGNQGKKVALITGITGQDGSYLAELLLSKGYEVHGMYRPCSLPTPDRITHLIPEPHFHLHEGDLLDNLSLSRVLTSVQPGEIYNFAAQPHVQVSQNMPEYTAQVTGVGVLRLLNVIKELGLHQTAKVFQASTSELFGKAEQVPQNESTPMAPRSPYGVAKLFAHWTVVNFRESNKAFAVNGLTFNHESPRRGENFVTRKITKSVAKVHMGHMDFFELGNMDSKRDWGHARDYVECMWRIMQLEKPKDYVIATGELHSVREFVEIAFKHVGKEIVWQGKGTDEVGLEKDTGIVRVKVNPKFYRPIEANVVVGDPSEIKAATGWEAKTSFEMLVKEMMEADIQHIKNGKL